MLLQAGANPEMEDSEGKKACTFVHEAIHRGVEGRTPEELRQSSYNAILSELQEECAKRRKPAEESN